MASIQQMNNALPETVAKLRKNRFMANPSVCEYQPSVCSRNSINIPFIGRNIPIRRFKLIMRRIHGFTLVELVVAMAVAAILVTIAVPHLRVFVQNSRIGTQTNDLISDISLARSEAIKSGATATVCSSTVGLACDGGGNWTIGRLVWTDTNGNGALDAGETRRFREQAAGANTVNVDFAAADPLTFNNRGAPTGAAGGQTITFRVCDDRGAANGRTIVINPLGQARASVPPALCP